MRSFPLILACVSLSACIVNTEPEPRRPASGAWVGTANGVRIRWDLTEVHSPTGGLFGGSSCRLDGLGSLTILATGDSLPMIASGFCGSGSAGVLVNMTAPHPPTSLDYEHYGSFWGGVDASDALVGNITAPASSRGPLATPSGTVRVSLHHP